MLQCPWGPPWPLHVSAPHPLAGPWPQNHLNFEMIGYLMLWVIHCLGANTHISHCPENGLEIGERHAFLSFVKYENVIV